MSSWLSISLPNPNPNPKPPEEDANPVLGNSIGRQLRGVAAFFAPPPLPPSPDSDDSDDDHASQALIGIKKDLVEIGTSISRLASNLLQLQGRGNEELRGDDHEEEEESEYDDDDDDDDEVVVAGTCDDVLDFVQELSLRPELWTGFPLELENDFHMSDAQKEHASTIETLIPTFATLRRNTCSHLSEQKFWMIYFLLLLPRLHEDDIEVLSTPEILETRELLLQKLQQNKRNEEAVETSGDVIVSPTSLEKELKTEEEGANVSTSRDAQKQSRDEEEEEEDSFSDLEDDKNDLSDRPSKVNNNPTEQRGRGSSASDDSNKSNDWVRLGGSSRNPREKGSSDSEDSNGGWLSVDGCDLPAAV